MTADDCRLQRQHTHYHAHHHTGIMPGYVRKLQIAMLLALVYFASQALGSALSGSLALLADAGHKVVDIGAIGLALLTAWLANRAPASRHQTFGLYRLEILAALLNALTLFGMAAYILWEAFERTTGAHADVEGGIMLWVSGFGLLINLIALWVLFPAREHSLNVKGALLHLGTDVASSLGTMLAAVMILLFDVHWVDIAISVMIAILVTGNAVRLFTDAVNILMESVPHRLNIDQIRHFIQQRPHVTNVHDLHVWTITTGKDALVAHVQVQSEAFHPDTAHTLETELRRMFDLCHITIQLEPEGFEEPSICFQ